MEKRVRKPRGGAGWEPENIEAVQSPVLVVATLEIPLPLLLLVNVVMYVSPLEA